MNRVKVKRKTKNKTKQSKLVIQCFQGRIYSMIVQSCTGNYWALRKRKLNKCISAHVKSRYRL